MAATPKSSGGSLAEHGERHGKPPEVLGKAAATAPPLDRRVEARPIPGRAGAEAEPAAESERPLARRLSVDAERELDVMITDAERDHPGVESQQLPLEAASHFPGVRDLAEGRSVAGGADRKSTRLNSSHVKISYAVFCLKKKSRVCTSPESPSTATAP